MIPILFVLAVGVWLIARRKGIVAAPLDSAAPVTTAESPAMPPPSAADKAMVQGASAVMAQAETAVLGHPATDYEHQYLLAVAWLETSFGHWTGAGVGSNNWGAVQARPGEASFDWHDSKSDGSTYSQPFKTYATPVDGASDVVRHVLVNRPQVADALDDSSATIWRASLAMRRTTYYGSWCLKAVKDFGAIKQSSQKNPQTPGEIACEKEAVGLHVGTVQAKIKKIAPALGVSPIPLGSYEDAIAWYNSAHGGPGV